MPHTAPPPSPASTVPAGWLSLIDGISRWAGYLSAATVFVVVVLAVISALGRKLGWGSNALFELQWYGFALIFLLAAAHTLQVDEHVRVDVLAKRWRPVTRAWIDLIGHGLVLLPVSLSLLWLGSLDTWQAYSMQEGSADAGGLLRWPVKLLIPLGFALLILQTIAQMARQIMIIRQPDIATPSGDRQTAIHPDGAGQDGPQ